jgi:hypothetical protein
MRGDHENKPRTFSGDTQSFSQKSDEKESSLAAFGEARGGFLRKGWPRMGAIGLGKKPVGSRLDGGLELVEESA